MKKWGAVVLAFLCLLTLSGCAGTPESERTKLNETIPTWQQVTEVSLPSVAVTLYYQNDSGYLVPVHKNIPKEEDMLSAVINAMAETTEEAKLPLTSLRSVIPQDTLVHVARTDGVATVDFLYVPALEDALAENNLVRGIAAALLDVEGVQKVAFLREGKETSKLPLGTEIGKVVESVALNVETPTQGVVAAADRQACLYFEAVEEGVLVPVTRYLSKAVTLRAVLDSLAEGPLSNAMMLPVLPSGAAIQSVKQEKGIVTIDFNEALYHMRNDADMMLQAIVLTCKQFDAVKEVHVTVNGELFGAASSKTVFCNQQ